MRSKIEEYNAVVEAANKFTKSVAEGNSKYAKELFTEDACLFGFLNGKLERDFQSIYNITPAKWIREKRLSKARHLLQSSFHRLSPYAKCAELHP
jgi:methylphosphotriester-DNA--protein-cysteine methyltransferase